MKAIPETNAGAQWNNSLLDDLVFIKQHKRYRLSKRTLPSVLLTGVVLFFTLRVLFTSMVINNNGNALASWFIGAMLVIALVSVVLRYWRTLQFRSIATSYPVGENIKLIDGFLRIQQLNLYRHPKAPEVFQILSRSLGNSIQREVMIFIADDNRILVNSHFINQKWAVSSASTNAGDMAKRLAQWIQGQRTSNEITIQ